MNSAIMNSAIISNDLTQMVNFPTWIPNIDFHSPALLDFFLSSDASICSTMAFSPSGNSNHVVSVSIDFPINSKQNALFHPIAYGYSCADWDGLLRDAPSEDIFKVSASTAASEFCDQVQVGIDAYIPYRKYQVRPHTATCAAGIIHRNDFFCLYQQSKSCKSKVKFRQAIIAKDFLKLPKLHMLLKQNCLTSQKIGPWDFWQIANSVLNKGKSAIPPLFNDLEVFSLAPDKAKLFAKII